MKCSEFNQLIIEYLDSELNKELKEDFEKHKQECMKCNREISELGKASILFKKLKTLKFPTDLQEKIKVNLLLRKET